MSRRTKFLIPLALLQLLCLGFGPPAFALKTDRDEVFQIQADGAEIDETTGTSTYFGNVRITQGTMVISADRIEIKTEDASVIQITARMNRDSEGLAHYEQLPEVGAERVLADAREINYLIQEEKLHLAGKARLTQKPNRFEGEMLHYDIKQGLVNLRGTSDASAAPGRINLTLKPKRD